MVRQDEAAIAYCEKLGWALDNTLKFRDLVGAFRGKNKEKGALGQFLAAIKVGRIKKGDRLICESIDRLSRKTGIGVAEIKAAFSLLKQCGGIAQAKEALGAAAEIQKIL